MREPAELGTPSTQKRSFTATGGRAPGSAGGSSATHRYAPRSSPAARSRQNSNTSAPGDLAGGDQLRLRARR